MDEKSKKAVAQIATTSPMYVTKDGEGNDVIFTATDLVKGQYHLKSKKGKAFRPTKYKAHSMADIITGKDYGKTKHNE
jgi:hypothetical protein